MFQDEDGFMVTKMEMESCSDDSQPEPPVVIVDKKEQVKTEPKSQALSKSPSAKKSGDSGKKCTTATSNSGGKAKQPSIMNFFQKK